jgi:rare lipoprotein A
VVVGLVGSVGWVVAAVAGADSPSPRPHAASSAAHRLPLPAAHARAGAADLPHRRAIQRGKLSWYGPGLAGQPTASGERFDPGALTMAHPTLPLGTTARVTNEVNRRSVIVRVNDRGPSHPERVADVSRAAAAELGMVRRGIVRAAIEVLRLPGDPVDGTFD